MTPTEPLKNSCMQRRQKKNSCIGLPNIFHKSQEGMQETILCENISSLNNFPQEPSYC